MSEINISILEVKGIDFTYDGKEWKTEDESVDASFLLDDIKSVSANAHQFMLDAVVEYLELFVCDSDDIRVKQQGTEDLEDTF